MNSLIIGQTSSKPFQDQALPVFICHTGPGEFSAYEANVYEVAFINAAPKEGGHVNVDGVTPQNFTGPQDFIKVSFHNPTIATQGRHGISQGYQLVPKKLPKIKIIVGIDNAKEPSREKRAYLNRSMDSLGRDGDTSDGDVILLPHDNSAI